MVGASDWIPLTVVQLQFRPDPLVGSFEIQAKSRQQQTRPSRSAAALAAPLPLFLADTAGALSG
jgi:hypothetical protein